MRHFPQTFAFLRTKKDHWAFAEAPEGFKRSSSPPVDGNYFWAPDFFLEDKEPFLKPKRLLFLSTSELRERLQEGTELSTHAPLSFEDWQWEHGSKIEYEKTFAELHRLFDENVLEKAVPVVMDQASLPAGDPKTSLSRHLLFLFDRLAKLPDTLHPFFLADEEWIFGATPETLLFQKEDRLKTHAVAGTTNDLSKSLLKDPKERVEHEYVIREIKDVLSRYGEAFVGTTEEKILPGLKHLVTEMELKLSRSDVQSAVDIALALHPTPALGGFPKDKAFEWLKRQPRSGLRRRYGAPFGYVSSTGQSHIVVAIRALQLVGGKLLSIAGAGVVKDSVCEKEWTEIRTKKNSVFQIFKESES